MSEAVIVALITGGMSLLGVVATCRATARKTEKSQEISQAVMRTQLEELTREVRAHNHFAQRMPIVEYEIGKINTEIAELKTYHRPIQ